MQTALFKIWTRIAVSISYDENHHTIYMFVYICVCVNCKLFRYIYLNTFVYMYVCEIFN